MHTTSHNESGTIEGRSQEDGDSVGEASHHGGGTIHTTSHNENGVTQSTSRYDGRIPLHMPFSVDSGVMHTTSHNESGTIEGRSQEDGDSVAEASHNGSGATHTTSHNESGVTQSTSRYDGRMGGASSHSDGGPLHIPFSGDSSVSTRSHDRCQSDLGSRSCFLYRVCRHYLYCVVGGYVIVPGRLAWPGTESIEGGNARSFDFLMLAARNECHDERCVLITNPVGFRTQEQLHIHYRHYNGGGAALKHSLERHLCGTHGWQSFNKCGPAKARLYDVFPGVFSEVVAAHGGGSLANVGITVWLTRACGGFKTMILATTHCSIEHSISER